MCVCVSICECVCVCLNVCACVSVCVTECDQVQQLPSAPTMSTDKKPD